MVALAQEFSFGPDRPELFDEDYDGLPSGASDAGDGLFPEGFAGLFARLLARRRDYDNASRHPSRVAELHAARVALEDVRAQLAAQRRSSTVPAPGAQRPRVASGSADLNTLRVVGLGHVR